MVNRGHRGIFVGRLCPQHLGHEQVIETMIEHSGGADNALVVIGSSSAPLSLRHFFSYEQRRALVTAKFGKDVRIVGIPDYTTDAEWLLALDDLIRIAQIDPKKAVYYGGCEEDVLFFREDNRECFFLNRFDGTTPKISATEVRDALIHDRPLDGLISSTCQPLVRQMFHENWERFKRI